MMRIQSQPIYTSGYYNKIFFSNQMLKNLPIVLFLLLALASCSNISIIITNSTDQVAITSPDGVIQPQFTAARTDISCIMPKLYIYNDTSHQDYMIETEGVSITNVFGKYKRIEWQIQCKDKNQSYVKCAVLVNSGCSESGKNQMNWIIVQLSNQDNFQYLVNCRPDEFYKPFEWGLFILICFCTITITASSMYSRAWSYKGFGINVSKTFIIVFNVIVIVASILAYYFPHVTSVILKIVGSLIGTIGVMICCSQTLYLVKNRRLNQARFGPIRLLDIICLISGGILTGVYWLTNGMWIVNDILAVCTIVAGIKIFKIRSLSNGVFMLFSLLIFQIVAGLIVHYALKQSYNNMVIQMFQSPLVVTFPSITPQLYRKCAWLPLTNILFPGLFISYLRRFDKSRGTFLYLLIGYGSFYLGSILWMIVDMNTRHALPMAIISDPVTTVAICFFAMRRNELITIWTGRFFDAEMPDVVEQILSTKSTDSYIAFTQYTESLKIDKNRDSQISSGGQI